jgi:hypothetical protein
LYSSGLSGEEQLIDSYSKLSSPRPRQARRSRSLEALQDMSAYFHQHKAELACPRRDLIRELIVVFSCAGLAPEEAFLGGPG